MPEKRTGSPGMSLERFADENDLCVLMFEVELSFSAELAFFLRGMRSGSCLRRALSEKTAVKDVIEACGVPHPEVDLIVGTDLCTGERIAVPFAWQVQAPGRVEIFGVRAPADVLPQAPRLQTKHWRRFVADGHLGKLARNLRLLGIDTAYERDADDRRLLEIMAAEDRALLTRDRRLLMHSIVRHGYCPRSVHAEEQTREVLQRFDLTSESGHVVPYQRCLRCNSLLMSVPKSEVVTQLSGEPLTLRFYDDFRRCSGCGRIYWPGTHFEKLTARLKRLIQPS
ncbi:MAG TPA: Mut7-C RNAse domain-containing protein [Chthoniobacterales bacterium]